MGIKIFILEDDLGRISLFRRWFAGHDITQVDTCDAVGAFQPPYDVIFLDHDLGSRQLEDHEDNGHAFTKLIKHRIGSTPVVIHSFSPDGALSIYHELDEHAFLAPFGGVPFKAIVDWYTKS